MKDLRTIILAAGKGTRMKSGVPKVLHEVCGRPILFYVLDIARAVGSLKTYVVLGHQIEEVKACLPKGSVVVQQKKLLGTADAVKQAAQHLKSYRGDVLLLCGDTPLLQKTTVRDLIKKHKKAKAACTFLTTVVHQPHGYGRIIRDTEGRVVAIREEKDAEGFERNISEINAGVYCFKARDLRDGLKEVKLNRKKKEFYLTDIIELFVARGLKVQTHEAEDFREGLGINTREDMASAQVVLRQRVLKKLMAEGVTVQDPATTFVDADVRIGKDTTVRPFTVIEKDVAIGAGCVIGPFARLRPGTRIGDRVEVGNFAEVSRTRIGSKTFVKHFSFLGDALVGSRVNIGAGTITANFNGSQKNQTRIGDGAFIGSDSVLVAPVKIGKKSVVGAGSVVPAGKNVPDGKVVAGVPARSMTRRTRV